MYGRNQSNQPVLIKFLYLLLTNTHILSITHTLKVLSPTPRLTSPQRQGKVEGISAKRREEEGKEGRKERERK